MVIVQINVCLNILCVHLHSEKKKFNILYGLHLHQQTEIPMFLVRKNIFTSNFFFRKGCEKMQKNHEIWLESTVIVLWGVELDTLFHVVRVLRVYGVFQENGWVSDVWHSVGTEFKQSISSGAGISLRRYEI